MPKVSVTLVTYNHEKYIADAIQSILDQTFQDFELIIVNDGSTDRTEEVIKSFQDSRIQYIYQMNQGTSAACNAAIMAAKGQYIATMSGDDISYPDRLRIQYEYLASFTEPKIVFSEVDLIDDGGQLICNESFFNLFNATKYSSRQELLKQLFFKGNFLNAVTSMMEKNILLEAGLYNLASIQAQDFAMWVKLVKKYDFCILPQRLIKYRIRANSQNLSSSFNNSRTQFEIVEIYRHMFDEMPSALFKEVFANEIKNKDFSGEVEYDLEKAFLYLTHDSLYTKNIGLQKLFSIMQDPKVVACASEKYNFTLPDLYRLMANFSVFKHYFELEKFRQSMVHSRCFRLREIIINKKLTPGNIIKIIYLLGALLTPQPVKKYLNPVVKFFKLRFTGYETFKKM